MCIIIAKNRNGRLPSEEELKTSFEYNSDGAGFMYIDNGKVVIDKGYMTYDSFIKHPKCSIISSVCLLYDNNIHQFSRSHLPYNFHFHLEL